MNSAQDTHPQVDILDALDGWDEFEEQVDDFVAWPPVSMTMSHGTKVDFDIEQRRGYVEVKDDGLRSTNYVQEGSVAAGSTVWVNIDERETPSGSKVATFAVCALEDGFQWQRESRPGDASNAYGPVIRERFLAAISPHDQAHQSQVNDNVVTLGSTFRPVFIDSSAIDAHMWRPAPNSTLVTRATEDDAPFRDPTRFLKNGFISRVPTGGTKGEWVNNLGTINGSWRDYQGVGPDGCPIFCTEETATKRHETITLHKQWNGNAWESNGYFSGAQC